jgi:peptidoglycan hydrolase CwlO-like protein
LNDICTKRVILCDDCNYPISEDHRCVKSLTNRLESLEKLFSDIQLEIIMLKKENNEKSDKINHLESRIEG